MVSFLAALLLCGVGVTSAAVTSINTRYCTGATATYDSSTNQISCTWNVRPQPSGVAESQGSPVRHVHRAHHDHFLLRLALRRQRRRLREGRRQQPVGGRRGGCCFHRQVREVSFRAVLTLAV